MTSAATSEMPGELVLDIRGAFVRRADLSFANLERANLSYADCTNALFRGANLKKANLKGTILRGADLRDAANLTREQLSEAVLDDETRLPDYLIAAVQRPRS